MLGSGVALIAFVIGASRRGGVGSVPLLWAATLLMAIGFASSLPCAITLPSEVGVHVSPQRLLMMNLAGSAGECFAPFLLGAAFERGHYSALGGGVATLNLIVLSATFFAQRAAAPAAAAY